MNLTKLTGQEIRNIMHQFRARLQAGEEYSVIKTEFAPYLAEMNRRASVIAKKYGTKPKKISFIGLMR